MIMKTIPFEAEFRNWLIDEMYIGKDSANSYISYINGVNMSLKENEKTLYEKITYSIDNKEYKLLIDALNETDTTLHQVDIEIKFNKSKKTINNWITGINRYKEFIEKFSEDLYLDLKLKNIEKNKELSPTEKQVLVKTRLGQSHYKNKLISLWGKCPISKCQNLNILIASHIKAYQFCLDNEKYDKYNGLLLTPTYDKLFDSYLISFEDSGKVIISKELSQNDRETLNLNENIQIKLFPENLKYLEYHRTKFSEREKKIK